MSSELKVRCPFCEQTLDYETDEESGWVFRLRLVCANDGCQARPTGRWVSAPTASNCGQNVPRVIAKALEQASKAWERRHPSRATAPSPAVRELAEVARLVYENFKWSNQMDWRMERALAAVEREIGEA